MCQRSSLRLYIREELMRRRIGMNFGEGAKYVETIVERIISNVRLRAGAEGDDATITRMIDEEIGRFT